MPVTTPPDELAVYTGLDSAFSPAESEVKNGGYAVDGPALGQKIAQLPEVVFTYIFLTAFQVVLVVFTYTFLTAVHVVEFFLTNKPN